MGEFLVDNSQNHSDDQLHQVLQTYQTYTESQSPTRQVNAHITYHVAQANHAMHKSFVDGGANGGLAGSDVTVLSTSSRQCSLIVVNNHDIPGLDLVQCAAPVNTNHGIVSLIMMNMLIMAKVTAFIPQDKLNGILTQCMITQFKLEDNKGLLALMDKQCH